MYRVFEFCRQNQMALNLITEFLKVKIKNDTEEMFEDMILTENLYTVVGN